MIVGYSRAAPAGGGGLALDEDFSSYANDTELQAAYVTAPDDFGTITLDGANDRLVYTTEDGGSFDGVERVATVPTTAGATYLMEANIINALTGTNAIEMSAVGGTMSGSVTCPIGTTATASRTIVADGASITVRIIARGAHIAGETFSVNWWRVTEQ